MPDNRPPAMFLADSTGLDFLNTIATPADLPVEWLANGDDLLAWLEQARLVPPEAASTLRTGSFPGELDAIASQARSLREWFRGFVKARKGRPLPPEALADLAPISRILERDESFETIVMSPDRPSGFARERRRRWRSPDALLIPIAEALADLVCSADFSLVKSCEGPACTLLFLDTTQARARRWCSMAICGNRAKQAAHRERSRKTGQES
ncbi:CGNR zinc finger domain-containing protein [Singulisphaera sp. PoT]|uniref:CGNR zinc finger domain-containing protein n=1 Tax=Singulisphaera sp. PoT TaxID=3411797 RepID=UPI003BF48E3B